MVNKALEYAEGTLGVHEVHVAAVKARNSLDETFTRLSEARDNKRQIEYAMADREQEILAAEWGKHPDMAQTRMDKHFKTALYSDAPWRALREQLSQHLSTVDGLECDAKIFETDIKIAVSRLQELGGYLTYLAAVKQAASTESAETPGATA